MKRWIEPQPVPTPDALRMAVGGHPLVAATLARRGILDPSTARAFLDPKHYLPTSPNQLPGLDRAVERLSRAMQRGESICVWGDFDVDGQTATSLLVATLRELGAPVTFHIPVRENESHGVNLPVLRRLVGQGIELLLTCDTGIAAHQAVDFARQQGVDVLITDHHDLPATLPNACAVINPKLLPESHPLATLPGVGVAYKLAEALVEQAGRSPNDAHQYLDLVALGIVADLALLFGDTRYLLQRGLEALRDTRRPGLLAMMAGAELNAAQLTEEHIAFVLGPRLNALGRLADANLAVEFLTTEDRSRARVIAAQLEGLNAQRQLLTSQVFQAALAQIERDPALLEDAALVLSQPHWPAGVIGIVASRLVERYNRPVVLIAAPPGQIARGSARSVDGCNITAAIAAQADLLEGFGGHAMAAGLSVAPERIPALRRRLSRTVEQMLGAVEVEPTLPIDAYVPLSDLTLELVQDLEQLAPFGAGNPALVLASRGLTLRSHSVIGRTREHRQVTVEDGQGVAQRVIWWQGADWPLPQGRFDLAYTVRTSNYRGQRDIQVEWLDARPVADAAIALQPARPTLQIVDHRHILDPVPVLQRLRTGPDIVIWCEADARDQLDGRDRTSLSPARTLIIWTTPPGREELRAALKQVRPEEVVLFAVDPELDRPQAFLARLAGLVKHALRADGGQVRLTTLAAATAQRQTTVRLGLEWLAARGHIVIERQDGDTVWLATADRPVPGDPGRIDAQLRAILEETAAYRAYFRNADAESLLES